MTRSQWRRPVVLGEVLFDCFDEGSRVLGGAAFNVAWHLQGFGLRPLFISQVGDDADGEAVLAHMSEWGMETVGVGRDPDRPTGVVQVALKAGIPTFSILADQAYDFMDADRVAGLIDPGGPFLFYHGSLAARSPLTAAAIAAVKARFEPAVMVDVNLRTPWWSPEGVRALMQGAGYLKVNQEELALLDGGGPLSAQDREGAKQRAQALADKLGTRLMVITLGDQGAGIFARGKAWFHPIIAADVVDTVGAGDAFSSIMIVGLYAGWDPETILARASQFAAGVCGLRGAVPAEADFYLPFKAQWGMA